MPRRAAGLLVYRIEGGLEVLIAHPGGPFWAKRNEGAWSIPKGELEPGEDELSAACREFTEELSLPAPPGPYVSLGEITQRSGKVVVAWAVEGQVEPGDIVSNTVEVQWRGRRMTIPEIDRVAWVSPAEARRLLNPAQAEFVDRLERSADRPRAE